MHKEIEGILNDLIAEQSRVDCMVNCLSEDQWMSKIATSGQWTIKDAILHLAHYDSAAVKLLHGLGEDVATYRPLYGDDPTYRRPINYWHLSAQETLSWWREDRTKLNAVFLDKDPKDRVPWARGLPPMSIKSLATSRFMELWAHAVDIKDGLDITIEVDDSIGHILFLAWQSRPNAYRINDFALPDTPIYLELTLPSGKIWTKGEANATNVIKGNAKDWALVSTRRRNWMDTDLSVTGDEAQRYASVVQTFAGLADKGPEALSQVDK